VLRLCRELVQAGFEPSSPLEAYRGDLLCLRARSIGEAAKMEVTTSDTGRPVFVARVDTQAGLAQDRYRLAPDTTMTTAHLYLFSDACPSDWLVDGQDDVWHTVVNLVFQSDPGLYSSIEQGQSHEKVLLLDPLYVRFINQIQSQLPSGRLHKWKTGPSYRERFCRALMAAQPEFKPLISACSFQEMTLWASKAGLLADYNRRVGGIEGRGIDLA
jgi:hypothetical protein